MSPRTLSLTLLEGRYAVCRLQPDDPLPGWAFSGDLQSVTRTPRELSVITTESAVPADVKAERGFRALEIEGPLEFSLTGVLVSVAAPLAEAGISIFAMSTYDTDVVLVPGSRLEDAVAALEAVGHTVRVATSSSRPSS